MRPNPDARQFRNLVFAMSAVVLAFALSSGFAQWRAAAIDAEVESIDQNALPTIEHLTSATAALRQIEVAADDFAENATATEQPALRHALEAARRTVDDEWKAYAALPAYPVEAPLRDEFQEELVEIDRSTRHMFATAEAGDVHEAQHLADRAVRPAVNRAGNALRRIIGLNAAEAHVVAKRIGGLRRTAGLTALFLDAFSVLLAVIAGLSASRALRNYTRLLRAHSEIVERRADELEQFAARVAHDLLSPLSALTYCLATIRRSATGTPAVEESIVRANACVRRAHRTTEGLFEFARAGAQPEPGASADVAETLAQVAEELASVEESARPEIEIASIDGAVVACSQGVLASILGNLLQNAAKYMRDSPLRRIEVRIRDAGERIHTEVRDTGPGLAPEIAAHVFDPYVRAAGLTQPGLGLGLATVKRLCEAHGGTVGVESSPGEGSLFWFELPKGQVPRAPSTVPSAPAA